MFYKTFIYTISGTLDSLNINLDMKALIENLQKHHLSDIDKDG